jgi:hypothetical protein
MAADSGQAAPPALCLQLTVWTQGRWQARADWGEGCRRLFDSPFELARFVAHPPAPPASGSGLL